MIQPAAMLTVHSFEPSFAGFRALGRAPSTDPLVDLPGVRILSSDFAERPLS